VVVLLAFVFSETNISKENHTLQSFTSLSRIYFTARSTFEQTGYVLAEAAHTMNDAQISNI